MRRAAVALALVTALAPAGVAAHGRPAVVTELRFHPTDPDHLVARGTWGFAVSRDEGASWR